MVCGLVVCGVVVVVCAVLIEVEFLNWCQFGCFHFGAVSWLVHSRIFHICFFLVGLGMAAKQYPRFMTVGKRRGNLSMSVGPLIRIAEIKLSPIPRSWKEDVDGARVFLGGHGGFLRVELRRDGSGKVVCFEIEFIVWY